MRMLAIVILAAACGGKGGGGGEGPEGPSGPPGDPGPASHFCTDWELDQAHPPPIASGSWVDPGNSNQSTRFFRQNYSTQDTETCGGWTSSSPTVKPDGLNIGRGLLFTSLGGITTSWV